MIKKLWIMRHGEALSRGSERVLTAQGYEQSKQQANTLYRLLLAESAQQQNNQQHFPLTLWASPLTRAQQTAQAVLEGAKQACEEYNAANYAERALPKMEMKTEDLLVPEASTDILTEYIGLLNEATNLMVISHMPLVANWLQELCPGIARYFHESDIVELEFKPAGESSKNSGSFMISRVLACPN